MNESKISVRYAKALLETAQEKSQLDTIRTDMESIYNVANEVQEFNDILNNPVVKPSVKAELINKLFSGKIHEISLNFLNLILNNRREQYIQDIARVFLDFYKKQQGIKTAVLTTAVEVEKDLLTQIKSLLETELKSQIELSHQVKEQVIGGFVLKIDDLQYDASVLTSLNTIKKDLLKAGTK